MAKCEKCLKNPADFSGIVHDIYYKDICQPCLNEAATVSSGHARWSRTVDAEDHQADIMQPYNSDGSLNVDFARLYPKQAQALFTPDEIDSASRK